MISFSMAKRELFRRGFLQDPHHPDTFLKFHPQPWWEFWCIRCDQVVVGTEVWLYEGIHKKCWGRSEESFKAVLKGL